MSAVLVWWAALQWSYALAIVLLPIALLCLYLGIESPKHPKHPKHSFKSDWKE
jgi:hypothetical protein